MDEAWDHIVSWAVNSGVSGEPFPLSLIRNSCFNGRFNVLARGKCKTPCQCGVKMWRFSISARYDATQGELVLTTLNPHLHGDLSPPTPRPLYGFEVASTPTLRSEAPSKHEAMQILNAWAADPSTSGEPFSLSLRDRTSPSAGVICRMMCKTSCFCHESSVCRFVAQANFDVGSKLFYISKKNMHVPRSRPGALEGQQDGLAVKQGISQDQDVSKQNGELHLPLGVAISSHGFHPASIPVEETDLNTSSNTTIEIMQAEKQTSASSWASQTLRETLEVGNLFRFPRASCSKEQLMSTFTHQHLQDEHGEEGALDAAMVLHCFSGQITFGFLQSAHKTTSYSQTCVCPAKDRDPFVQTYKSAQKI